MSDPLTANWNMVESGVLQLGPVLQTLLSTEAGVGPGAPQLVAQIHAREYTAILATVMSACSLHALIALQGGA